MSQVGEDRWVWGDESRKGREAVSCTEESSRRRKVGLVLLSQLLSRSVLYIK